MKCRKVCCFLEGVGLYEVIMYLLISVDKVK